MRGLPGDTPDLADWFARVIGCVRLGPDEAAVFLAAALVLLPPELELRSHVGGAGPVPERLRAALRTLWLRTGRAPPASTAMPEQPLAPGLIGISWRRLRSALSLAPRNEPQ